MLLFSSLFHFTLLMLLPMARTNMLLPAIAGMTTVVSHSHSLLMLLLYS
jgi:hypothetical protein